jgi:hypothetical protein
MRHDFDEREQVAQYQSLLNRFWYEVSHNEAISGEVRDEITSHLNEAEQALHFFLMYGKEKERVQSLIRVVGDLLTHGTTLEPPLNGLEKQKKGLNRPWFTWE